MPTQESAWYEMIGQNTDADIRRFVQCESFATALSPEEMSDVTIFCKIPITKAAYTVLDGSDNAVLNGEHSFGPDGVATFALKEAIPLEALMPYTTAQGDYRIETSVTLASGHEVGQHYTFRAILRTGKHTEQFPVGNLREQLDAIPVANPSMTEAELRQICLDYIRLETEFPFRFKEDFVYTIASQRRTRRLLGGKIYGGIPYVTRGAGNLYRIAEIYDPATGVLDATSDIFDNIRLFGNACSGSASMAWARVVTSAYLGYTMFMTEANGFLPVGPYRYPKENVTKFIRDNPDEVCCRSLCDFNGEQTMYESYALMKPADGLVCNGHVRMNSAVPVVVRKPDGTVDPDESYTLLREQVCYTSHRNHLRIASDGSHYVAQGRVDYHNTFRQLFTEGYVPFTFAEFKDSSLVQPARIRLAVEPNLDERVLTANYAISDVFAERNGRRYSYRNKEFFRKELKLGDIFPAEALGPETKLSCRLYNGQLLEVVI